MKAALAFFLFLLCASDLVAAPDTPLPEGVQRALDIRGVPADTLSVFVADLDSGETVLRWNGDVLRNPGSTLKLLTTLVALDTLGPGYTWRTDVYALGDISDNRLDGDLLLKGTGDPFLVTERVWLLLRRIRHAGINEISGDLLLDDSHFAVAAPDPGAFDRQPLRAYNVEPNALLMNFKVLRYWFEHAGDGKSVRISLEPPLGNLQLVNKLRSVPGGCSGYQRGIAIETSETMDRMTFRGSFPSGCDRYAMDRTALSHNEYAFGLFASLWRESGGLFDGGWKKAVAPEDAEPLLSFRSLPLADIITRVNKHSNNVMARQLLFTLSAEKKGAPGTEAGGREVIIDWLAAQGFEFPGFVFENGAGLSRQARITADDLGALLKFAWRRPYMPEYVSSLSLAGVDGTLRSRFEAPYLAGNAHLKTGSLDHVVALAGYLHSAAGRRYAVVTLQNHPDIHRGPGYEVQEALLRWLYSR
jgi:D-alanyl-D-alanine carboxypeptidase/D-alanyl-D-alanine-endopeptidase (penicillin-binding protein 4)